MFENWELNFVARLPSYPVYWLTGDLVNWITDIEARKMTDTPDNNTKSSFESNLSISSELRARLLEAADIISDCTEPIKVVSHYDGDGISAAGIISNALLRKNKRFHTSLIKSLNREKLEQLSEGQDDVIILLDFGSAQINDVEEILVGEKQNSKVIICDHHKPVRESDKIVLLNCHYFKIDGTYEACAATMALLVAIAMDPPNWDLSDLAIGGGIADKQHLTGWRGLNSEILLESIEKGIIKSRKGLKLSGANLKDAIENSVEPFFIGITGNSTEIDKILNELGLASANPDSSGPISERPMDTLTESQLKILGSYLALRLLKQGVRPEFVDGIITDKYWSVARNIDIEDLSGNINACGRLDRMGLGLAVCLFDQNALDEAKALRATHKRKIIEGLQKLIQDGIKFMDNLQYLYTTETTLAGTFAGLGMIYLFDPEKPVLALSERDGEFKISGRGTSYLIDKGLDLAAALNDAASMVDGVGGGHSIAAGATIPQNSDKKFLEELDKIIGNQMSN